MTNMSRRHFLQSSGLGAAALLFSRTSLGLTLEPRGAFVQINVDSDEDTISFNRLYGNPPLLGRVHGASWIRIFEAPRPAADSIRSLRWGHVMPVYRGVRGESYDGRAQSDVWFETDEGYVHSAYVVPCHEIFNEPEEAIAGGFWGEISVPVTSQYSRPTFESFQYDYDWYKCYWGQVHRIVDRADDPQGIAWYRLYDDIEPHRQAWIQARHVRRVLGEEFALISPEVEDKQLVIELAAQLLTCYENGVPVLRARIASGTSLVDDQGTEYDFSTPYGEFAVQRKRPSRRMRGGQSINLPYDVNGVPWITYFTYTGAAIHGAYWHNNFGAPRSHGCINVTPDAAKWIYRWTQPYVTQEDEYYWTEPGETATPIVVI